MLRCVGTYAEFNYFLGLFSLSGVMKGLMHLLYYYYVI